MVTMKAGARVLGLALAFMTALAPVAEARSKARVTAAPKAAMMQVAMRWDHRNEASVWTMSTMQAVAATRLTQIVPRDIGAFCPGYVKGSPHDRAAFWTGLLSAIAKHESTWNPRASGGGGRYLGLMQISPATWGNYRCSGNMRDGSDNLACAVRIMSRQVARDGVVGAGGRGGVARDWGPMKKSGKRGEIAAWTKRQVYCQ